MPPSRPLSTLAGLALAVFGIVVVLGSLVVPQTLVDWYSGLGQIGVSTAASLSLLGAALLWRPADRQRQRCLWALLVPVLLLSLLALFGVQLQALLPVWTDWPGGMSPLTAVALMAAALCLGVLPSLGKRWLVALALGLPLIPLAVALISLASHAIGAQIFLVSPGASHLTSLPTALALLVLVAGMAGRLAERPDLRAYFIERTDRQILAINVLLMFLLTMAAGMIGAGLMALQSMRAFQEMLVGSVGTHAAGVEVELHRDTTRIAGLLRQHDPAPVLRLPPAQRGPAAAAWLDRLVRVLPEVVAIQLRDAQGREVGRVNREDLPTAELRLPLKDPAGDTLFWSGSWWLEMPMSVEHSGELLGEVVFLVAEEGLNRLFLPSAELGKSGETVVCGDTGSRIGCLVSALPSPKVFVPPAHPADIERPADLAMAGRSGSAAFIDRHGNAVVSAYTPVGDSGLALVRKLDATEIYAPVRDRLVRSAAAVLLLMAIGGTVVYRRVYPLARQLRYGRAQLSAILDQLPESVITTDGRGTIRTANETTARLFGVSAEGLVGRPLTDLVPALVLDAEIGTPQHGETPGRRGDGSELPLEMSAVAIEFEAEPYRIAILRNIAERKASEAELRRWAQIFEYADWGVVIGSPDGRLAQVNPAFARMHGWPVAELIGRPIVDVFAPEVRHTFAEHVDVVHRKGHHRFESVHVRRDGSVFPVMVDATAVYDDQGELLYRVANVQDVSDLKAKEQALKRSEELLRLSNSFLETVFAQAAVGVVVCDPNGRFLRVNRAFGDIVGYSERELLRMSFRDIADPDADADDLEPMRRMLAGELRTYQREQRFRHQDGAIVWVLLAVALVRDESWAPTYIIGQIVDISERKRIGEALEASRQELRELAAHGERVREEERKRIAHEVHDELGQLLTALKMEVSLLRIKHGADPAVAARAGEMRELVERTISVVRHVASNLRPAALDLGLVPALEWLVEDFSRHTGVPCTLTVIGQEGELDDTSTVVAFRIIQESLTNVARHARASEVAVAMVWADAVLRLTVNDNGVGFDPGAGGGGGFGLLGMRERLATVGGACRIDSAPGHGTILHLEIPLARTGATT